MKMSSSEQTIFYEHLKLKILGLNLQWFGTPRKAYIQFIKTSNDLWTKINSNYKANTIFIDLKTRKVRINSCMFDGFRLTEWYWPISNVFIYNCRYFNKSECNFLFGADLIKIFASSLFLKASNPNIFEAKYFLIFT